MLSLARQGLPEQPPRGADACSAFPRPWRAVGAGFGPGAAPGQPPALKRAWAAVSRRPGRLSWQPATVTLDFPWNGQSWRAWRPGFAGMPLGRAGRAPGARFGPGAIGTASSLEKRIQRSSLARLWAFWRPAVVASEFPLRRPGKIRSRVILLPGCPPGCAGRPLGRDSGRRATGHRVGRKPLHGPLSDRPAGLCHRGASRPGGRQRHEREIWQSDGTD
jgi:hypothetical protein